MLRQFFRNLFGNAPIEFPSAFSLEESVSRLRQRTGRIVFHSLFRQSAVGRVTADSVRLQRIIPFFGNSFKPIFVGKFLAENGRVILRGRFTMFLFTKVFMVFWFSFGVSMSLLGFLGEIRIINFRADAPTEEPILAAVFFILPFGFVIIGAMFMKFCWWLSRGDMEYLESVIKMALN